MKSKKQEKQVESYSEETKQMCKEIREGKDFPVSPPKIRLFDSGATRDNDDGKLDYEGFLSPLVLERYAQYMHAHRKQSDGNMRASDNWQKGIPIAQYMKSKWRHLFDTWKIHRGLGPIYDKKDGHMILMDEALCAEIFNAMGHLHELLKQKEEFRAISPKAAEAFYGDF